MPCAVVVNIVHASPYTLADEATLLFHAQRPCWPTDAAKLHSLFLRTHLVGDFAGPSSFPCSLIRDMIRFVRRPPPPSVRPVRPCPSLR